MWDSVLFLPSQCFLIAAAPRGTRPERPRRVSAADPGAARPGLGGAGPRRSRGGESGGSRSGPRSGGRGSPALERGARRAGEGGWPRVRGAAGGGSSSGSSSSRSGGGQREARGEAMVAAPARAHMPGARGGAGARKAGAGPGEGAK